MKINLEFDDNDLMYQLMDGMFVVMLKNALREDTAYLESGGKLHPKDKQAYEKNIAAYEHLIEYYGGLSEVDDDDTE
jgi:hypothetical protein